MTGKQQDKMIDKIIDEFKGYAMIGDIVHEKDWYDLATDIVNLFAIPDVGNNFVYVLKAKGREKPLWIYKTYQKAYRGKKIYAKLNWHDTYIEKWKIS